MAQSHFCFLVHLNKILVKLWLSAESSSTFKNNEILKRMGSFARFVSAYEVQFRARVFCQLNFDVGLILISSKRQGKVSMLKACKMRILRFSARIAIPFCFLCVSRKTRPCRWIACIVHFCDIHPGLLWASEIWTKQGSYVRCRK